MTEQRGFEGILHHTTGPDVKIWFQFHPAREGEPARLAEDPELYTSVRAADGRWLSEEEDETGHTYVFNELDDLAGTMARCTDIRVF